MKPRSFARLFTATLETLLLCCVVARGYDWQPPPDKITVLAVVAHPDDEGIFFGGALPYYSSVLQVPTMLICMTAGRDSVRDEELRCAASSYGLRYEPLYGRFPDINSGTITNAFYGTNTIDITWDYWANGSFQGDGSDVEAGKQRAINYVAEQIRRYRPDVILTMNPITGETGHDNHKASAYAAIQAFTVAADSSATAPNLVGLPPWQAQKLYVHLHPTNRLFHTYWETPYPALADQTPHQIVNTGLTCHVSQGPSRWLCASVYPPVSAYNASPSEWWGLYASTVGPDSVLSSGQAVNGYSVPAGVGLGSFLEHLSVSSIYFTEVPRSLTAVLGSTVLLSSVAKSMGAPVTYQWQYNGARLAGLTAATLTLPEVQPADAGAYVVVVNSGANSITSPPAVLTVITPPVVTASLQTRTNLAGTVATFSASASGAGPLSYQWLLNGAPLQDNAHIHGATASNLQITSVQPADAGSLVLKVSNLAGATLAPVANLVVVVPPPCVPAAAGLVGWWPGDGNAADIAGGGDGTLQGGVTANAAGAVGGAFNFDGASGFVRIPESPQVRPANLTVEAWVLFKSLDSPASGSSPAGQQYIVFKQNSRTTDFEGYSLTKTRTANGDVFAFAVSSASGQALEIRSTTPISTGVWYHVAAVRGPAFIALYVNGRVENQASVSFPQDYGANGLLFGSSGQSYWDHKLNGLLDEVALYNRALSAGEIASVYVAGSAGKCREASVSVDPAEQTLIVGSNALFTATASGPALQYQWLFNGTALPGATNSGLLLPSLDYTRSGTYSVLVSNFAGAVLSAPATLRVIPLPGIVMPLRLSGAVGTSWRIEYMNDLYPPNNWKTLATVALTNASQLYFDTTALTQRQRFYRLVPLQ